MNKILVMGPAWVGDMVMAQSLFKQLKIDQPDCQISVAAPAWTMPLLERMPEVSQAIALPFKHGDVALRERFQCGRSLANQGFTQAILLTNSLKSAILPWAANIPVRTGFKGEMRYGLVNDMRPLDKSVLKKTVERFVALGLPKSAALPGQLPQPALLADPARARNLLTTFNILHSDQPVLGLCPGAEYGEAKRWPSEYYAEVANHALNHGWQVWLFGSEKDKPVTASIQQHTHKKCVDLAGTTKLGEAIDLMSLCHTVISNDSGLMHVAAALDKKLIAIYGSSDPKHTPPMHPQAVVEYLALECSPCFERVCPLGHLNCLKLIRPDSVIGKIVAS
ncbi:lipopolysaccharide heptosyltransferase II [Methylophilus aquaticus]|uniref:lipopolysaccharide heptosyltransferase II n=1 Tax=Methylophilus aquaticus TaxID=1971610 RepID=A0ABT9JSK2_9PROT|nr:lipopolysaccharide heptosyltransferase II [Methylophilus aquaticus]MDP8567540.1 lipopolysaccharide heptosyltransferase II [Methylophilus aquaticus]